MPENAQETFFKKLQRLPSELKLMFEQRLELFLLDLSESLSVGLAKTTHQIIGFLVLYIGIIYASASLGIWLGDVLENQALGFLVISSPFLLIGVVLLFIKPQFLINATSKKIEAQFLAFIDKSTQKADKAQDETPKLPEVTNKKGTP